MAALMPSAARAARKAPARPAATVAISVPSEIEAVGRPGQHPGIGYLQPPQDDLVEDDGRPRVERLVMMQTAIGIPLRQAGHLAERRFPLQDGDQFEHRASISQYTPAS